MLYVCTLSGLRHLLHNMLMQPRTCLVVAPGDLLAAIASTCERRLHMEALRLWRTDTDRLCLQLQVVPGSLLQAAAQWWIM